MDLIKHIDNRTEKLRQLYPDADDDLLYWFAGLTDRRSGLRHTRLL